MKRRPLPPLKALSVFEVAAKCGSFVKAAEALFVTPAAVSHQIKTLEEFCGHLLFERLPNGLALTRHGMALLPGITAGMDNFESALALVNKPVAGGGEVLVVSALPSFAQEWLIPRLVDFRTRYPDIDVLIQTEYRMADLANEELDVAIRFARAGFDPSLRADLLARETVTPVCSPSLMNTMAGTTDRRELRQFTLLNSSVRMVHEPWMSWDLWLEEANLKSGDFINGPRFSDPLLILRAAMAGKGMVLGRSMLIHDHLAQGRLVAPFRDWIKPILSSYFLVTTLEKEKLEKVRAFREWILECAQAGDQVPAPASEPLVVALD
ncbi:LysR substrate-binding domain-containing protein [Lacisediminimonas sp.]|uniref:LysR substrate-binding domain-containing protein n=1 Tax=Lacisediminimonas sp. TaxID=3060582 RepID=UPI0027184F45|nr:LysR substrate-binding domain-containing protein [Lacisediminimonas sp.]MDO8300893.1 LysR substrate-binding domain-containing protein [Lacisediminimonas sp.]